MKLRSMSVDIDPKSLTFDQVRQLIDALLSGNPKEGRKLWDSMAVVRGPDLGLGGTPAKIDGSTPGAESARVARKKQTCTILRGRLFPGAAGCSAADIDNDPSAIIHLPPKAEWDHYDKHVHKVAILLNIPYEIEGEAKPEDAFVGATIEVYIPGDHPVTAGSVLRFHSNFDGGQKVFVIYPAMAQTVFVKPISPMGPCKSGTYFKVLSLNGDGEGVIMGITEADAKAPAPEAAPGVVSAWPVNMWDLTPSPTVKHQNCAQSTFNHMVEKAGSPEAATKGPWYDSEHQVVLAMDEGKMWLLTPAKVSWAELALQPPSPKAASAAKAK